MRTSDLPVNDDVEALNDLIEVCRNGEQGFAEAAESVKDTHLKNLFIEYSQQRSQFVSQLQSLVQSLGGRAETSGTLGGVVHRKWMDIKAAVTGGGEHAIAAECERGEDIAKDAYQEALEKNLSAEVRSLVERQYQQVKEAHNNVRALEVKLEH